MTTSSNQYSEQLATQIDAQDFRRLHRSSFLFVLLNFLTSAFFPIALYLFINAGTMKELWALVHQWAYWGIGILALISVFALLFFLSYRFMIRDGDVVIKHGILFRQTRYIPLNKVHNVTLRRNILHRWLGVAEMRLESAGSGQSSEALLRVLSLEDAQAFEHLINLNSEAQPSNQTSTRVDHSYKGNKSTSDGDNLLPLGWQELLRLGMMSNQSIFLSIIFTSLTFTNIDIGQWIQDNSSRWLIDYALSRFNAMPLLVWIMIGIIAIVILSKLLDILFIFISYGNFSLTDSEHHITMRRGLLTRIESHVPHHKIQVWRIQQGPMQRLFARYSLHIDTAVVPGQNDNGARGIRHIIPIADQQTMARLITRWSSNNPFSQSIVKQHTKAPRRIALRYTLYQLSYLAIFFFCAVFYLLVSDRPIAFDLDYLILCLSMIVLLIPINILAALLRAQYAGWAIDPTHHLHWRDGLFWRKYHFCQCSHIQSLTLQHNFFDRRYGMGNLYADTMGANNVAVAATGKPHNQQGLNMWRKTPMSLKYIPVNHLRLLSAYIRKAF